MNYILKQSGEGLLLQTGSWFLLQSGVASSWLVHICRLMMGVG